MGLIEAWNWPEESWIRLQDCKDGHLYFIAARNSCLGVFRASDNSFIISRHKLGENFLFPEYHVDGEKYKTAYPLEDLGLCPIPFDVGHPFENPTLLDFLNRAETDYRIEEKMLQRLIFRGKRIMFPEKAFANHPELLAKYLEVIPAQT